MYRVRFCVGAWGQEGRGIGVLCDVRQDQAGRDQVASGASLNKDARPQGEAHLCGTDDGFPSSVAPD